MADAADGHHRDVHRRRHGPDHVVPNRLCVSLGAGDKGRAHAQVVRAGGLSRLGLRHGVGGDADDLVRPQQRPGPARLQILLAHMDAVGAHGGGDVHVVVDDAHHAPAAAKGHKALRQVQKFLPGCMLFPQLHHAGAAVDGRFDLGEKGILVRCPGPVRHGVEPHLLVCKLHSSLLQKTKNPQTPDVGQPAAQSTLFPSVGMIQIRFRVETLRPPLSPRQRTPRFFNENIIRSFPGLCKPS